MARGSRVRPVLLPVAAQGEDGQQVVVGLRQLQVQTSEGGPGHGGDVEESLSRLRRAGFKGVDVPIAGPVRLPVLAEGPQIRLVGGPEDAEGLIVLVKNRISGVHPVVDADGPVSSIAMRRAGSALTIREMPWITDG